MNDCIYIESDVRLLEYTRGIVGNIVEDGEQSPDRNWVKAGRRGTPNAFAGPRARLLRAMLTLGKRQFRKQTSDCLGISG
jgi:hypothetical protein